MENSFENILNDAEKVEVTNELEELLKEERWKKKRLTRITSSKLPDLMKSGRGKGELFGKTAINYLIQIKGQRRTGRSFENDLSELHQIKWGKEHEPRAFEIAKEKFPNIVSGNDGEEIIFREWREIFGDSPDFEGEEITGEIKCPVDMNKIEIERETINFFTTDKNGKRHYHQYFWQFIGHFIGNKKAKKLIYVVYDGYNDEAFFHTLLRSDVETEIEIAKNRILRAEKALLISELNGWANDPIININNLKNE